MKSEKSQKVKRNSRYNAKSIKLKEYIEKKYTYAIKPVPLELIAANFNLQVCSIKEFIYRHELKRDNELNKAYAKQLINQDVYSTKKIMQLTSLSFEEIQKIKEVIRHESQDK